MYENTVLLEDLMRNGVDIILMISYPFEENSKLEFGILVGIIDSKLMPRYSFRC
jgi:hypothetical protein